MTEHLRTVKCSPWYWLLRQPAVLGNCEMGDKTVIRNNKMNVKNSFATLAVFRISVSVILCFHTQAVLIHL